MTYIFFTDTSLTKCVSITNQKAKNTDFSKINFYLVADENSFPFFLSISVRGVLGHFFPIFVRPPADENGEKNGDLQGSETEKKRQPLA